MSFWGDVNGKKHGELCEREARGRTDGVELMLPCANHGCLGSCEMDFVHPLCVAPIRPNPKVIVFGQRAVGVWWVRWVGGELGG